MAEESEIEKEICRFAERSGCYVRKFTSHHAKVPDRIIVSKNGFLFLEIKRPGEMPDEGQADEIRSIMRAGGLATWCDNADDGKRFVAQLMLHSNDFFREICHEQNERMPHLEQF